MDRRIKIKKGIFGGRSIGYDCPHCSSRLKSPINDAGTSDTCPSCGGGFIVPGKEERDRICAQQELEARRRREVKELTEQQRRLRLEERDAQRKRVTEEDQRRRRDAVEQERARAASNISQTRRCPYCAEEILISAKKCKHCGEFLDPELRRHVTGPKWNPGIAAILSLLIPGAGQMYKGQVGNGLVWFVVVVVGYVFFILPGLILHLCCIVGAASGDPNK